MGKNKLFTAITLIACFATNFSFAQISGSLSHGGNGTVNYSFQTPNTNDLVFILYGDGTFGYGHQSSHQFAASQTGYTTTVFSAKKDDANVPDKMVINTGQVIGSASVINPTVWMPSPIDIKTSWSPATGYENYFIVAFKNESLTPIPSGRIQLHYNDADIQINTQGILLYNNATYQGTYTLPSNHSSYSHTMVWQFSNLQPMETKYIYVPATVLLMNGDLLNLSATMTAAGNIVDPLSIDPVFFVRRRPHDPNFKTVDKECLAYGLGTGQKLEYAIGFFNDGTFFANDVLIEDQLSPRLAGSTANVTGYEHEPQWEVVNQLLGMQFVGIMLPGINQKDGDTFYAYSDCASYVTFDVCTSDNLYQSDNENCILNSASIIFDTQPSIETDTAIVCLEENCEGYDLECPVAGDFDSDLGNHLDVSSTEGALFMGVSPNPAFNYISVTIDLGETPQNGFSLDVIDRYGTLVKRLVSQKEASLYQKEEFYVGDLTNGVYMIVLSTGESVYFEKFIKQ